MSQSIWRSLNFNNTVRILNLPNPVGEQEPATKNYVDSAVEGISWKASVRVASQANVNLISPGATIDGITLSSGDRILIKAQTIPAENGIYLFDTASTPLVRSLDANSFRELEQAVVNIEEGTNAGNSVRQTAINGVLETDDITWASFGTGAPPASEATAGVAEIVTQAEIDGETDDSRFITSLKLANWAGRIKKFTGLIGDGTATSFTLNHNFNTRDVQVSVFYNSGNYEEILVEIQRSSVNAVTIVFDAEAVPTTNQFKVVVIG